MKKGTGIREQEKMSYYRKIPYSLFPVPQMDSQCLN